MSAIPHVDRTLRSQSLGFLEAIGQSLANISPTLTPALNIGAVVALAGQASWLVYGIATIALLLVGMNISALASRFSAAGSFFVFISQAMGPMSGGMAGWALVAAYVGTAMALLGGLAIFVNNALVPAGLTLPIPVIYVISAALVWYLAYRDIKLSSRISLAVEAVSITVISVLILTVFGRHVSPPLIHAQLTLVGANGKGMSEAIVLAIFSFVGFESAATLGKETRDPLKNIPRAIMYSMIGAGVFFMVMAFALMIAYKGNVQALGNDPAPLLTLLKALHLARLATVIYAIASVSLFACVLASVNAASRLLFSMGRYHFIHRSMGLVHAGHKTPHVVVAISSALALLGPLLLLGQGPMNTYELTGTFATFGFIFAYLLISVAAPLYLRKQRLLTTRRVVLGSTAAVFMLAAFFGSVYPVPSYPYNILPYLFVLYLAAGLAWLVRLKNNAPQVLTLMEHDLESQEQEVFGRK